MKRRMGRAPAAKSLPRAAALSAGTSLGITGVLAALTAAAVSRQWIPESGMGYAAAGILIAGVWGGVWLGGRQAPDQKLPASLAAAGAYFVILLLLGALCFGGKFHGIPVTAALILGTAGAAALLGLRKGKGRKRKYKRYGL